MKIIITFFTFLVLLVNPTDNNYAIDGIQKKCDSNNIDSSWRDIKLRQNDEIIDNKIEQKFGKFQIKNLKKGKYTIEFVNTYGQIASKKIEVKDKVTKIEICTDIFIDTKENTLFSNIKSKDTLSISFLSSGCFHNINEEVKFYTENENLVGEISIIGKKEKTKSKTKIDLAYLILFEKKVRQMKHALGGCTTTNQYIFKLNNKPQFQVGDRSCDWDGYYEMKKEVFGIEE